MRKQEREQAIQQLEAQLTALKRETQAEELLQEVWDHLGPYTQHLPTSLRYKLQDFFKFDDSE